MFGNEEGSTIYDQHIGVRQEEKVTDHDKGKRTKRHCAKEANRRNFSLALRGLNNDKKV